MDAQTFLIPNFTYNGQVIENRVSPKIFCKHEFFRHQTHTFGLEKVAGRVLRCLIYLLNPSTRKSVLSSYLSTWFLHTIHLIFQISSIVFPSYLSSHLNINSQGSFVADENGSNEPLRKYSQKTLVIVLPGDLTVFDIGEQYGSS